MENPNLPGQAGVGGELLHEQHFPGAFDALVHAALVVRREAGVFAREDASLIGDESAEQGDVLVIKSVEGEIDFGFGTWGADFVGASAFFSVLILGVFAWHRLLLDFPVKSMTAESRIILSEFDLLGFEFLVA